MINEDIMLSEGRPGSKTNTPMHIENLQQLKLIEVENRMKVAKGWGGGNGRCTQWVESLLH